MYRSGLERVVGSDLLAELSQRRIELISNFINQRGSAWRYIHTGMTSLEGEVVVFRCGTGEIFRAYSRPLYSSSDSRRALLRGLNSEDFLLDENFGGADTPFARLGHITMILHVEKGTPKWNRLEARVKSRALNATL
jgi:hypothetical protein